MQRLTADDDARDNGWNVERSQWCVLEVDQDLRTPPPPLPTRLLLPVTLATLFHVPDGQCDSRLRSGQKLRPLTADDV